MGPTLQPGPGAGLWLDRHLACSAAGRHVGWYPSHRVRSERTRPSNNTHRRPDMAAWSSLVLGRAGPYTRQVSWGARLSPPTWPHSQSLGCCQGDRTRPDGQGAPGTLQTTHRNPSPGGAPATKHNTRSTSALNAGGAGITTQPKDPIHRQGAEAPQRSDCPTVGGGQPPAPGSAVHVPGSRLPGESPRSLWSPRGRENPELRAQGQTRREWLPEAQPPNLAATRDRTEDSWPQPPLPSTAQAPCSHREHEQRRPDTPRGHRIHFHSVYLLVPTPCTKLCGGF